MTGRRRRPRSLEDMRQQIDRDVTIAMVTAAFALGFGVSFLIFGFIR
jgi:hypothetical protein